MIMFIATDKICKMPGCNGRVHKNNMIKKGKHSLCIKHACQVKSGRITFVNRKRDIHRLNIKGVCAYTGITWGEVYKWVKRVTPVICNDLDIPLPSRYDMIRFTTRMADGDHRDGNHANNNPDNIQTLYRLDPHKLKSLIANDYDGWKNKR